jgi:Leucine rich repeat
LSFNKIDSLATGSFNGLAKLEHLNLNGNSLLLINVEVFESLSSSQVASSAKQQVEVHQL